MRDDRSKFLKIKARAQGVFAVAIGMLACIAVGDLAGFYEDRMHGISWEAGVAIAATLRLRHWGAAGVFIGYFIGRGVCGHADLLAIWESGVYAGAAYAASELLRSLHRRRERFSYTSDWLSFFGGVSLFTGVVVAGTLIGLIATGYPTERIAAAMSITAIVEPLGAAGMGAVLANLAELKKGRLSQHRREILGAAALTALLVSMVGILLHRFGGPEGSSTIIILLALPISIWLALMPHSLAGATISMLGFHSALWLAAQHYGTLLAPEYALIAASYLVLVLAFQLVHALNRDRLAFVKALASRRDELEQRVMERTEKLQAMTERAVAADKTKSEFLAKMSHELRTPLNGVIGMSGVLAAGDLDAATRQQVEVIRSSGMHLLDLIEGVLTHSKLSAKQETSAKATRFNLQKLIAETVAEASVVAPPHLGLVMEIEADAMEDAAGDPVGLRQVLTNLIGNAMKFTHDGEIVVRVKARNGPTGGRLFRIEVADSGVGIPLEDQARIFRPFEQVDGSATRAIGGAGLGLTISREIVARMGGELGVESVPGEGATFWFEFPSAADAAAAA